MTSKIYSFNLDTEQMEELYAWRREILGEQMRISEEKYPGMSYGYSPYTGAICGSETFSFTPISLGTVVKVKDSLTGKEIDLSNYSSW